jgi:dienelactone hydrolase
MRSSKKARLVGIGFLLTGWLGCEMALAATQDWTVQTLSTRTSTSGQKIKLAVAIYNAASVPDSGSAPPVRHVLVYPHSGMSPQLTTESGAVDLRVGGPWVRGVAQLRAQGVSVVYVDVPSDAAGRDIRMRPSGDVKQDLAVVAKEVHQRFPKAQVHLAGLLDVAALLDVAGDIDGFDKVVLTASTLADKRTSDWSGLSKPVLMLHAPTADCEVTPFLEAQAIAKRSRFTFVQVGYRRQEEKEGCTRNSQYLLTGHETVIAKTVADWLDGKEITPVIGYANPQIAWREEIITYQAPSTFGSNRLEATLLLPEARRFGAGPYPVLVWNHGDVVLDQPAVRYKSRVRELWLSREFLNLGLAVLIPSRRGVGMSEGTYPRGFRTGDADATYKARLHAEDILPALAWLKTRPELDASRVVLAGQSAGGEAVMYIASQNPVGLIGAIDFSGGRPHMTDAQALGYLNQMMVNSFAEFGKTTRIPTLWVFAENDSRYTAETIRASYEAFQAAGGKGRLLLSPPIAGDGHFIYAQPTFWRAALKAYLSEIGLVTHGN